MEIYTNSIQTYLLEIEQLKTKYNNISIFRLLSVVVFFVFVYYYLDTQNQFYILGMFLSLILFFALMKKHDILRTQKEVKETLLTINQKEVDFLKRKRNAFANGLEFNDFSHPYAYDLDIFGEHSLFQYMNRTETFIGKKTLGTLLLQTLPNDTLLDNQIAVKELTQKVNWRQECRAYAKISNDNQSVYETLLMWTKTDSRPLTQVDRILLYVLPLLFIGTVIVYKVMALPEYFGYATLLFLTNLSFTARFIKRIKGINNQTTTIDKIIKQYSLILVKIEKETFQSKKLIALQQELLFKGERGSEHLKKLSRLFSKMDTSNNIVAAILFNGSILFHIHVLKDLIQWKKENAAALESWLAIIGEFEALNSLANFAYNNPSFAFPELNTKYEISFSNLSHPLLSEKTRIGNEVSFQPQSFMILTGSNMSGKSTFLRSLGINMVLAGIGSPVCATQASIHPLPVLVSMRLSDSLSDSESYFFAEIKRLKQIMDALHKKPSFVLLDEILRGTNSDDKRSGTIEVVKKVIANKAIGAIATHDIEVCLTTDAFPELLTNKCFEVEIRNDELYFDYKLHDGICKNKSATFLMKKMGVI
jgi:DNA mismatch repair ATPase MutS